MKRLQQNARRAYALLETLGITESADYVSIENPPYMRLVVERLPYQDRGDWKAVSLAHYFEQNGDLCQDPEMVLWVNGRHRAAFPVSFQQALPPIYQEAATDITDTGISHRPRAMREQQEFLLLWLRNLTEQGFMVPADKRTDSQEEFIPGAMA